MTKSENALSKNRRIKNRLRTVQPENGHKFKNSDPQSKFTGSFKKRVYLITLLETGWGGGGGASLSCVLSITSPLKGPLSVLHFLYMCKFWGHMLP